MANGINPRLPSLPAAHCDRIQLALYSLWLLIPGLALLGFGLTSGRSRKKRLISCLRGCLLFGGLALMTACRGDSNRQQTSLTPAGTYTVTVTGVSGATAHTTTLIVTVQ
jgi:hypothetical protein